MAEAHPEAVVPVGIGDGSRRIDQLPRGTEAIVEGVVDPSCPVHANEVIAVVIPGRKRASRVFLHHTGVRQAGLHNRNAPPRAPAATCGDGGSRSLPNCDLQRPGGAGAACRRVARAAHLASRDAGSGSAGDEMTHKIAAQDCRTREVRRGEVRRGEGMCLCLTCFHLSRAGSLYCGFCSRSFGVRFCGNKHANAPHVRFCTTCASSSLSEATRFVRLGWISSGLTALLTLAVWRWGIAHLKAVAAVGWDILSWMLAVLLNTSASAIGCSIRTALTALAACWILGQLMTLLPGDGGKAGQTARAVPAAVLGWTIKAANLLARRAARELHRLLFSPPRKSLSNKSLPKSEAKEG